MFEHWPDFPMCSTDELSRAVNDVNINVKYDLVNSVEQIQLDTGSYDLRVSVCLFQV